MRARRALVDTTTNTKVNYSYCSKMFDDILETSHIREAIWRSNGHKGTRATLVDAQGAMLVLQRVRNRVKQGAHTQRADKIEEALRDLCKNELQDTSLERFDARKRLAEMERSSDQLKRAKQAGTRCPPGCDETSTDSQTAAEARKHNFKIHTGQKSAECIAGSRQLRKKDDIRADYGEIKSKEPKQCANIQCTEPHQRFRHIAVQCRAGGQDWAQYWGKDLCIRCYNRHLTNGTLETCTTAGKRKRDEEQDTVPAQLDHCANTRSRLAACSKPVESPKKRRAVGDHSSTCSGKETRTMQGKVGGGGIGIEEEHEVRGSSALSSGKELSSKSRVCANPECVPASSTVYIRVPENCTAGGRDWSQLFRKDLCNACYERFRTKGTFRCDRTRNGVMPICQNNACGKEVIRGVLVREGCSAGGQDWSRYFGMLFCSACYGRYQVKGRLEYVYTGCGNKENGIKYGANNQKGEVIENKLLCSSDKGPKDRFGDSTNAFAYAGFTQVDPAHGSEEGGKDGGDDFDPRNSSFSDGRLGERNPRHCSEADTGTRMLKDRTPYTLTSNSQKQRAEADGGKAKSTTDVHKAKTNGLSYIQMQHAETDGGKGKGTRDFSSGRAEDVSHSQTQRTAADDGNIGTSDFKQRRSESIGSGTLCANPKCSHVEADEFYRVRSGLVAGNLHGESALIGKILCKMCFDAYKTTGRLESEKPQRREGYVGLEAGARRDDAAGDVSKSACADGNITSKSAERYHLAGAMQAESQKSKKNGGQFSRLDDTSSQHRGTPNRFESQKGDKTDRNTGDSRFGRMNEKLGSGKAERYRFDGEQGGGSESKKCDSQFSRRVADDFSRPTKAEMHRFGGMVDERQNIKKQRTQFSPHDVDSSARQVQSVWQAQTSGSSLHGEGPYPFEKNSEGKYEDRAKCGGDKYHYHDGSVTSVKNSATRKQNVPETLNVGRGVRDEFKKGGQRCGVNHESGSRAEMSKYIPKTQHKTEAFYFGRDMHREPVKERKRGGEYHTCVLAETDAMAAAKDYVTRKQHEANLLCFEKEMQDVKREECDGDYHDGVMAVTGKDHVTRKQQQGAEAVSFGQEIRDRVHEGRIRRDGDCHDTAVAEGKGYAKRKHEHEADLIHFERDLQDDCVKKEECGDDYHDDGVAEMKKSATKEQRRTDMLRSRQETQGRRERMEMHGGYNDDGAITQENNIGMGQQGKGVLGGRNYHATHGDDVKSQETAWKDQSKRACRGEHDAGGMRALHRGKGESASDKWKGANESRKHDTKGIGALFGGRKETASDRYREANDGLRHVKGGHGSMASGALLQGEVQQASKHYEDLKGGSRAMEGGFGGVSERVARGFGGISERVAPRGATEDTKKHRNHDRYDDDEDDDGGLSPPRLDKNSIVARQGVQEDMKKPRYHTHHDRDDGDATWSLHAHELAQRKETKKNKFEGGAYHSRKDDVYSASGARTDADEARRVKRLRAEEQGGYPSLTHDKRTAPGVCTKEVSTQGQRAQVDGPSYTHPQSMHRKAPAQGEYAPSWKADLDRGQSSMHTRYVPREVPAEDEIRQHKRVKLEEKQSSHDPGDAFFCSGADKPRVHTASVTEPGSGSFVTAPQPGRAHGSGHVQEPRQAFRQTTGSMYDSKQDSRDMYAMPGASELKEKVKAKVENTCDVDRQVIVDLFFVRKCFCVDMPTVEYVYVQCGASGYFLVQCVYLCVSLSVCVCVACTKSVVELLADGKTPSFRGFLRMLLARGNINSYSFLCS
jgi:hypothetical protein